MKLRAARLDRQVRRSAWSRSARGSSLGREGPTVQICAGVAKGLGKLVGVSPQNLKLLLPVGAAAGIAAAFNAPIAAVTFTIEEIVGKLDQTLLSGVIVAAALAAVVERSVLGENPVFTIPQGYGLDHASSLVLYAALGVAAALVSVAFTESLLWLRRRFNASTKLPVWVRPAIGGARHRRARGRRDVARARRRHHRRRLRRARSARSPASSSSRSCSCSGACKLVATVFSYASGGAGGIFAPALFIGAMLGGAFGALDVELFGHDALGGRRVRARRHGRGVRRDHPRADHVGPDHHRDDRGLRADAAADDREHDGVRPRAAAATDADLRGAARAGRHPAPREEAGRRRDRPALDRPRQARPRSPRDVHAERRRRARSSRSSRPPAGKRCSRCSIRRSAWSASSRSRI